MDIKQKIISAGRRNRPATNPASSLFRKQMQPQYITIHNTGNRSATATASNHAAYLMGNTAANAPVSWHYTVDDNEIWQHLPLNEAGFHAGDNLGPGNTNSIGIEICENQLPGNMAKYLEAEELAAKLCAKLISEVKSLKPFPDCMKQHFNFSGKNCPSVIRGRANGWNDFLGKVEKYIKTDIPQGPLPTIQRRIGVEVDGRKTNEEAYLIDNATYVKASFIGQLVNVSVTGHGDHIKIRTPFGTRDRM